MGELICQELIIKAHHVNIPKHSWECIVFQTMNLVALYNMMYTIYNHNNMIVSVVLSFAVKLTLNMITQVTLVADTLSVSC